MKNWIKPNGALLSMIVLAWLPGRVLSAAPPATAPATRSETQPAGPEVERIILHPSATTQPALQYKLLPDPLDETPGNAAMLYATAVDLLPTAPPGKPLEELWERVDDTPFVDALSPEQLAHDAKTEAILQKCAEALRRVDAAARCQDVDWDAALRELGFDATMSYLNHLRHFANILRLKYRFQMARGDLSGALRSMQTSFSMAVQLNRRPVLVEGLVAAGVSELVLDRGVEEWVGLDHSPNLYWALSSLPRPYFNYPAMAHTEQAAIYFQFPALRAAARGEELSAEQWRQIMLELMRLNVGYEPVASRPPDLGIWLNQVVASALPKSREYLLSIGTPKEKLPGIAPEQAVGVYFFHEYRVASDEIWKAWELPYLQSIELMRGADERFGAKRVNDNPFLGGVVWLNIWRAKFHFTHLDRRVAMYRTLEALRNHLALHGGLPDRLDEITDVPVPIDPFTDKPFSYRREGRTAVLEALASNVANPSTGQRFEITVAK